MIKHLIEYISLKAILIFFGLLPFRYSSFIGGWFLKKISPTKFSTIAKNNLNIAFPEIKPEEQKEIINGMWDNLGRSVAEFSHLLKINQDFIDRNITIHNKDNLKYLDNGGFIFTAHLANWEISQTVFLNSKQKIYIVYRALNNPYTDQLIKKYRSATGVEMIPKGKDGAKKILEAIKNKGIIIMLLDQRQLDGILIPFFNQPCYTSSSIATLAIKYNLPIIPAHTVRTGTKFDIWVDEPLNLRLTSDRRIDIKSTMVAINAIIENWVRKNPSQWFWIHRRWSFENTHKN